MQPAFQRPLGYLVLAAALVADPAISADLDALPARGHHRKLDLGPIIGRLHGGAIRHCLACNHWS